MYSLERWLRCSLLYQKNLFPCNSRIPPDKMVVRAQFYESSRIWIPLANGKTGGQNTAEALLRCSTPGCVRGAALTHPHRVLAGSLGQHAAVRAAPLTLPAM